MKLGETKKGDSVRRNEGERGNYMEKVPERSGKGGKRDGAVGKFRDG